MAWTTVTDAELAVAAPARSINIIAIRDNISELASGADPASPKIQTAALDDGIVTLAKMASGSVDTAQIVAAAIGRSEIANATATTAGSLSEFGSVNISLNDWALFPMIHTTTANAAVTGNSTDGSASSPRFRFGPAGAAAQTYDVDHRYIISA